MDERRTRTVIRLNPIGCLFVYLAFLLAVLGPLILQVIIYGVD